MGNITPKAQYAVELIDSLEKMRQENVLSDFTIKVGSEEFRVHRAVLAASSKYFRALLQSNMVEVQQGYVDLRGVKVAGVRICISYMYSGEAEPECVGSTIEAAHLMQLDGLVEMCFAYLKDNISAETCVSTIALSRLYGHRDVEGLAEIYLSENLELVSMTESFSSISKDDFVHYVTSSTSGHKVLWQALTSWVYPKQENREKLMLELMEVVKITEWPFQFLFEIVQNEGLVKNSSILLDHFLQAMFSRDIASNLTADNLFILREFVKLSNIPEKEEVMEQIKGFLLENFEDLTEKEEFVHLDEEDMLMLLRSTETKCSSEEIKWKAILNWTKHDRQRKKLFKRFFRLLQLREISDEFIRNKIRVEPMVKESKESLDLIVEVLLDPTRTREERIRQQEPKIALLHPTNGGVLQLFDVKDTKLSDLSQLNGKDCEVRSTDRYGLVSCNGELYIMVNEILFKFDRDKNWIRLRPMAMRCEEWPDLTSLEGCIFVLTGSKLMTCYNPAENDWTMDLPGHGLDPSFCTVSSGKDLIVLGGLRNGEPTNEVKRYDTNSRVWSNMTPMLKKRNGASAAMMREMMIVTGGQDEDGNILKSVECYIPLSRSWTMLADMKTPRAGHSTFTVSNKLYVCGRDRNSDGELKENGTIEVFNEEDAKWKTVAEKTFLKFTVPACEYQSN